jgi:hypothetical protein
MNGHRLTIVVTPGLPGTEVSWQVTGLRTDMQAIANRIAVDVDRPANERGCCLHFEEYGVPRGSDSHPTMGGEVP